ncbi:hypothetical protein IQ238_01655 [Pleurocapsales cyanobacterium LEGE 06147]|nr:hypothetical protein [Pleurocapsales cyanobacterium LEGE 06147]
MNSKNSSPLVPTIWLSLVTSPFILGFLAVSFLSETSIQLGRASEELFRGTRLPVLHFPNFEPEVEEE